MMKVTINLIMSVLMLFTPYMCNAEEAGKILLDLMWTCRRSL